MRVTDLTLPVLLAALVLGPGAEPSSAAPAPAAGHARAAAAEPTPFARVYLALRGCTSCSHCRTTIRQMAKSSAKGGEARVAGDQVEVRYDKPRLLPLRDIIRSLADHRLHDLSVVDVLFEARGAIATAADGTLRFTLTETGQSFPVTLAATQERSATPGRVRLVAVVDGWREKGGLTLVAREVHAGT